MNTFLEWGLFPILNGFTRAEIVDKPQNISANILVSITFHHTPLYLRTFSGKTQSYLKLNYTHMKEDEEMLEERKGTNMIYHSITN